MYKICTQIRCCINLFLLSKLKQSGATYKFKHIQRLKSFGKRLTLGAKLFFVLQIKKEEACFTISERDCLQCIVFSKSFL